MSRPTEVLRSQRSRPSTIRTGHLRSEQLEVAGDRVDPVGEVRPDGAAGRRRDAVELRPDRIDAEVGRPPRFLGRTDDPEKFLLRGHPDAVLAEGPVEPAALKA